MDNIKINNLTLKIISVLAAIIMWMYVMNEQNPQIVKDFKVSVRLENLNSDVFALKDGSQQFYTGVKVKGRRSIINDLKPEDFNAEASLRGRIEGENILSISINPPDNVEMIDFSPREIMVTLDSIVEEQLPVAVEVKGTPAGGFGAETALVKPQEIVAKGPRTLVDSIKRVVAQVDISDRTVNVVGTLPLRVIDGQGKDVNEISFRPDMVEVTVPIVPVSRISVRPDIKGDPPEGYIIRDVMVDTPTLLVTADSDILANLQAIDTDPLYIQGYTKTLQTDVNLKLPPGIRLFEEEIKTVKVTVTIERLVTASVTLSSDEIEVQNIAQNTSAVIEEQEITVVASGPESQIDKLNAGMVKLFVDVGGLSEAEHQVRIRADILRPYVVTKTEPAEIGVILSHIDIAGRGDDI